MNIRLICVTPVVVRGHVYDCGKCPVCRRRRASVWAQRMEHEATFFQHPGMFCTLTYDEDNVPLGGFLSVRDIQLFMKRLRKSLKRRRIRYFLCGEYGPNGTKRPHYHIIFFGLYPKDEPVVFKAWNKCSYHCFRYKVVNVAKYGRKAYFYTSSYTSKKYCFRTHARGVMVRDYYKRNDLVPEFQCHSRGIGFDFIKNVPLIDGLYMRVNGKSVVPCKAYRKRLNLSHELYADFFKRQSCEFYSATDIDPYNYGHLYRSLPLRAASEEYVNLRNDRHKRDKLGDSEYVDISNFEMVI